MATSEPSSQDEPNAAVRKTRFELEEGTWVRVGLPLIVFAVLVGATALIWRTNMEKLRQEGIYDRAKAADRIAGRAGQLIAAQVDPLNQLAEEFRFGRIETAERFEQVIHELKVGREHLAIAWVDSNGVCKFVHGGPDPELRVGTKLTAIAPWDHSIGRAATERESRVVQVNVKNNRVNMTALVPVISGEGSAAPYVGCVATRLDMTEILSDLLHGSEGNDFDVDLYERDIKLYASGRPIAADDATVDGEAVKVINRFFRLRVRPTESFLARRSGSEANGVLWAGLLASVVLAGAVERVIKRRGQSAIQARRQLAAIESITRNAGVITAMRGAAREAFEALAKSASESLGMKSAAVSVVDVQANTMRVVARLGFLHMDDRDTYSLDETPGMRKCLETGEVLAIEDSRKLPNLQSRLRLEETGIRSAMLIPLVVEGKALGMLTVGDSWPKRFTVQDERLAEAFGSQAALILASLSLYEQKDQALENQRKLAREHEALFQIATEIYRSEDLDQSLQRLADTAPALVGVDLCTVSLRVGEDETRMVAITGNYGGIVGERSNNVSLGNAGRVWRTGEMLVIEDGPNDPTLHPKFRHRLRVGSIIYLPLIRGDREPIGMMSLIRHCEGSFSSEQLELAKVLAVRASAAIETARLYEAARESANAQTMLLRELNHRVKNNLSSIVALLSMDRPAMPADAEQWLNRLTDRVTTMARTHELFVGGHDHIDLRTLVTKLLPVLSVIKPGGVEVRTDIESLDVQLDTKRAVSLAMVLNELCWNALEHGTDEKGVLWIRGRRLENGRVEMVVEDEGKSSRPALPEGELHGSGLKLVQAIVSRELHGQFSINSSATGGTVARIEILVANTQARGL